MRVDTFKPYRDGHGPTFILETWLTGEVGEYNRPYVGYTLMMDHTVLFHGKDYNPAPIDGPLSDGAIEGLMGFLTLRPGDTDAEYFEKYTPEQMAYCDEHAETLSACVEWTFNSGERDES